MEKTVFLFPFRNFFEFWAKFFQTFGQKTSKSFQNFHLRVQSKICGKNSFFLFFFSEIFRILSKKISDFWPKNFKNLSKLPSTFPEEQFVAWSFLKFWIVSIFLQKLLARFSKFYLRVESKICGRNKFFILPFWIFSDFERKGFQTFGQKTSWICQNYLVRVQRNNLLLEFVFKKFESFQIFCRKPWHGSQKPI